jgi:predicted Rdx family selenoprotein
LYFSHFILSEFFFNEISFFVPVVYIYFCVLCKWREKYPSWINRKRFKIDDNLSTFALEPKTGGIKCICCEKYSKYDDASEEKANYALGTAFPKYSDQAMQKHVISDEHKSSMLQFMENDYPKSLCLLLWRVYIVGVVSVVSL